MIVRGTRPIRRGLFHVAPMPATGSVAQVEASTSQAETGATDCARSVMDWRGLWLRRQEDPDSAAPTERPTRRRKLTREVGSTTSPSRATDCRRLGRRDGNAGREAAAGSAIKSSIVHIPRKFSGTPTAHDAQRWKSLTSNIGAYRTSRIGREATRRSGLACNSVMQRIAEAAGPVAIPAWSTTNGTSRQRTARTSPRRRAGGNPGARCRGRDAGSASRRKRRSSCRGQGRDRRAPARSGWPDSPRSARSRRPHR